MADDKIALVVGCTGVASNKIIPQLLESGNYKEVYGVALQLHKDSFKSFTDKEFIPMNMNINSKESVIKACKDHNNPKITHVFWYADGSPIIKLSSGVMMRRMLAASQASKGIMHGLLKVSPQSVHDQLYGTVSYLAGSGRNERNPKWLGNVIDGLVESGCKIKHFALGCGGKWFGMHIGPDLWPGYSTPYYEDKTKGPGPLSYFDAQEFVAERGEKYGFTHSVVLPSFIIGRCPELSPRTQSFGLAFAVYSCLLKAKGLSLMYPGNLGSYNAKIQLSTSNKIADVMIWSSTHNSNQIFNVTSCPPFSWSEVWSSLGDYFGIPTDGPKPDTELAGISSADKVGIEAEYLWNKMVEQYGLQKLPLSHVFNADFLDKSFMAHWDSIFSSDKLREFGYPEDQVFEGKDAKTIMYQYFEDLIENNIIPHPDKIISGNMSVIDEKDFEKFLNKNASDGTAELKSTSAQARKPSVDLARKVSEDLQGGDLMKMVSALNEIVQEDKKNNNDE